MLLPCMMHGNKKVRLGAHTLSKTHDTGQRSDMLTRGANICAFRAHVRVIMCMHTITSGMPTRAQTHNTCTQTEPPHPPANFALALSTSSFLLQRCCCLAPNHQHTPSTRCLLSGASRRVQILSRVSGCGVDLAALAPQSRPCSACARGVRVSSENKA